MDRNARQWLILVQKSPGVVAVTTCERLGCFARIMSERTHSDRLAAATAAAQHGVLNAEQMRACGIGDKARRHRRQIGRYQRLLPGVDRIGGAVDTWEQQLLVAQLWAGVGSVVSHRSAAALWGFDSCPPGAVDLTVFRRLRSEKAEHVTIHRYERLSSDEVRRLGPFRVTAPARTLLDLAAVVSASRLEVALDSALRRRTVTIPELRLTLSLNARRGRRGVQAFRAALDLREEGYVPPASELERKLARLLAESDLPAVLRQYPVIDEGRELYRIDFAYPDHMLAIEVDGWHHHSDRMSWSADQGRSNVLTMRGWRVLRFTWTDVTEHPERVLDTIRRALL